MLEHGETSASCCSPLVRHYAEALWMVVKGRKGRHLFLTILLASVSVVLLWSYSVEVRFPPSFFLSCLVGPRAAEKGEGRFQFLFRIAVDHKAICVVFSTVCIVLKRLLHRTCRRPIFRGTGRATTCGSRTKIYMPMAPQRLQRQRHRPLRPKPSSKPRKRAK